MKDNVEIGHFTKYVFRVKSFAHGSCARSTRGSQNLAALPKRHDNSHFLPSKDK